MYNKFIKRLADIFLALIMLPFILIVSIPIAISIKVSDHGPILYKSKRIGRNKVVFDMLKFRTMKVNAPDWRLPDGATFNSHDDPRVTPVGRFLRETSLDEIMQIWNVLMGQMSFIGPRPGDVESIDTYEDDEIDKFKVRPGITGYAQAYYRNSASVREKRLMDAWYANHVSVSLDIKIFIKTIVVVLLHKDIYQTVEEVKDITKIQR
jgi:lipopolysaccharide/colanic/teichoic acid biosynthesis glycosyltransferase